MLKVIFTLLPLFCFILQFFLSKKIGTLEHFYNHKIVFIADWAFVVANYYSYDFIKKIESEKLFWVMFFAFIFTVFMHGYWQYNHMDGGYMIDKNMVVLPAGWVHLLFMSIELVAILCLFLTSLQFKKNQNYSKACLGMSLYFILNYIFSFDYMNIFPILCMTYFLFQANKYRVYKNIK